MSRLRLLVTIALRNLFSSVINVIIGLVILFGSLLVVVGSSMLDSMDAAMSRSLTGSIAGHLQVYSSQSKDELSLFGQFGGEPDLSPIDDFLKLHDALMQVPNVKAVVPMGISGALVNSGNTLDLALAQLRELENQPRVHAEGAAITPEIESTKRHIRHMIALLSNDLARADQVSADKAALEENREVIARAQSDAFWSGFDKDPFGSLEFLENKIAPLAADADMLYLRYIGTNLDRFQQSFDRMQIVDGQPVPEGQRGFLFSKQVYEDQIKLKTARRLDKMKLEREERHKLIATDPELQRWVKQNQSQTREILYQLDDLKAAQMTRGLQQALGSKETDLGKLLIELFTTDDQNFDARYKIFYEVVTPLVELYRVRIGDTLTIKAFTRSGYTRAINVKVYGSFNFKGLERSGPPETLNLMDIMSFRDLYGFLTADNKAEIEEMRKSAGAESIDRSHAEEALFGESSGAKTVVAEATPGITNEPSETNAATELRRRDLVHRVYSQSDIDHGIVLNAALLLKDPSKLAQTQREVQRYSDEHGLGLKVISWQTASGLVGQFIFLCKAVLYFAVLIIFVVALVIINNAMMMATLQRVKEIGTLRAIGARKAFVLELLLTETIVLGAIFGGIGALLGVGIVRGLGAKGIVAPNEFFYLFFAGPRLFPTLGAGNLITALVIVLIVSAASTLYPAVLATRVAPVTAMQADE